MLKLRLLYRWCVENTRCGAALGRSIYSLRIRSSRCCCEWRSRPSKHKLK